MKKEISYRDGYFKEDIKLPKNLLIEPKDLSKHVGEVLIFHNGYGYIVSAVLEEGCSDYDKYSYGHVAGIDYSDELDMSACYHPNEVTSVNSTLEYAYAITVQGIHHDQIIRALYVTLPTEDELKFRDHILGLSKETVERLYEKSKKEIEEFNASPDFDTDNVSQYTSEIDLWKEN